MEKRRRNRHTKNRVVIKSEERVEEASPPVPVEPPLNPVTQQQREPERHRLDLFELSLGVAIVGVLGVGAHYIVEGNREELEEAAHICTVEGMAYEGNVWEKIFADYEETGDVPNHKEYETLRGCREFKLRDGDEITVFDLIKFRTDGLNPYPVTRPLDNSVSLSPEERE